MKRSILKRINEKWSSNVVDSSLANCYTTLFLLPDGRLVKCDDIHYLFARTIGSEISELLLEGVARVQNIDNMGIEIKRPMTQKQRETLESIFKFEDHDSLAIECTLRGGYQYEFHRALRPLRSVPRKFDKFFES